MSALHVKGPEAERPVKVFGYPWFPALYVMATGLVGVNFMFQKTQYICPGLIVEWRWGGYQYISGRPAAGS